VFGADLRRYAAAVMGSAGSSGSQFLLTLLLLGRLPAELFAQFTFLVVVAQLNGGLAAALFSAPLSRLATQAALESAATLLHALVRMQLFYALAGAGAALLLGWLWHGDLAAGAAYAVLLFAGGLRQFLRVIAYTRDRQQRVVISDMLFASVTLAATAVIYAGAAPDLFVAFAALAAGNLAGLLVLQPLSVLAQARQRLRATLAAYREVWSRFTLWSLIGILATEATANAHTYIVTMFAGPAAFSPIAASAILSRPGVVALNALSEFERARMARVIAVDDRAGLARTMTLFRWVALAFWLATAVLTYLAVTWRPPLLFKPGYDPAQWALCAWLWIGVMLARTLYLPESTEMHARGSFIALAWPTLWSAPVSIAGVMLTLVLLGPAWSLAGVLAGEAVAALLVVRAARRGRNEAALPA
jgi:hypothetical protein